MVDNIESSSAVCVNGYTVKNLICKTDVYQAYDAVDCNGTCYVLKVIINPRGCPKDSPIPGLIDAFPVRTGWCQVYPAHSFEDEGSDYFSYCSESDDSKSKSDDSLKQNNEHTRRKSILLRDETVGNSSHMKPQFIEPSIINENHMKRFPRTPVPKTINEHMHKKENNNIPLNQNNDMKTSGIDHILGHPIVRTPMPKTVSKLASRNRGRR